MRWRYSATAASRPRRPRPQPDRARTRPHRPADPAQADRRPALRDDALTAPRGRPRSRRGADIPTRRRRAGNRPSRIGPPLVRARPRRADRAGVRDGRGDPRRCPGRRAPVDGALPGGASLASQAARGGGGWSRPRRERDGGPLGLPHRGRGPRGPRRVPRPAAQRQAVAPVRGVPVPRLGHARASLPGSSSPERSRVAGTSFPSSRRIRPGSRASRTSAACRSP